MTEPTEADKTLVVITGRIQLFKINDRGTFVHLLLHSYPATKGGRPGTPLLTSVLLPCKLPDSDPIAGTAQPGTLGHDAVTKLEIGDRVTVVGRMVSMSPSNDSLEGYTRATAHPAIIAESVSLMLTEISDGDES